MGDEVLSKTAWIGLWAGKISPRSSTDGGKHKRPSPSTDITLPHEDTNQWPRLHACHH
ncbi:MAG: hypothetical protein WAU15_01835 [Nitrosomonas sp.]